jgi:hypothetical protein
MLMPVMPVFAHRDRVRGLRLSGCDGIAENRS